MKYNGNLFDAPPAPEPPPEELHPFPDKQEYEYIYNGVMYDGVTGKRITDFS